MGVLSHMPNLALIGKPVGTRVPNVKNLVT